MIKFKIPLIAAGAVFGLAFIIGLVSGVRFSFIIIRAFVSALVSGGFVFGARLLLERFTPELFQPLSEKEAAVAETAGKTVNISIDDPIDMENAAPEKELQPESEAVAKNDEPVQAVSENEEETAADDVEEAVFDAVEDGAASAEDTADTIETTEEKTGEDGDSPVQEDKESPDLEDLEELPDLQGFAPADEDLTEDASEDDFMEKGTGNSGFDPSAGLSEVDSDTKTMVQAIQTVLKREP